MTLREYRNGVKNLLKRSLPHCMDAFLPKLRSNRKFEEPDYTAGLAINLPRVINEREKELACRLGLRFGGCYIHQKPYVVYEDNFKKVRRELGDLLVLCREKRDGEELFNAALLQLKMADGKCDIDDGQLRIYTEWPKIWLEGKFGGPFRSFDVYPKAVTQGALYSFVHVPDREASQSGAEDEDQVQGNEDVLRFTVASPRRNFGRRRILADNAGMRLEEFLSDFVIWQSGRSIGSREDSLNNPCDSWSRLIWTVVDQLEDVFSRRRNIGMTGRNLKREQGAFFNLLKMKDCLHEQFESVLNRMSADGRSEGDGCALLFIDKRPRRD